MAGTTTDTTLNVKMDAARLLRAFEQLNVKVKRVNVTIRDTNKESKKAKDEAEGMARVFGRLGRVLSAVGVNTRPIERLVGTVRTVREEVQGLMDDFRGLSGVGGSGGGTGGAGAGGSGGRRRRAPRFVRGGRTGVGNIPIPQGSRPPSVLQPGLLSMIGPAAMTAGTLTAGAGIGLALLAAGAGYQGLTTAMQSGGQYLQYEQTLLNQAPLLGARGGDLRRAGISLGFSPMESMMAAGAFGRSALRRTTTEDLRQALAVQRRTGIDVAAQGGLQAQVRRTVVGAGGSLDMQRDAVASVIGAGQRLNLSIPELSEFLSQQTTFLSRMAAQGQMVNLNRFLAAQTILGTAGGISNYRAATITQQMAEGQRGIGIGGIRSATDVRFLRAAGYQPGGGTEAFARAQLAMQDPSRAPTIVSGALRTFITESGLDPNSNLATLAAQRFLARGGTQVSAREARNMIGIAMRGQLSAGAIGQAVQPFQVDVSAGEQTVGRMGRRVIEAARLEERRLGVGEKVIDSLQSLESVSVSLAESMGGVIEKMGGPMLEAVDEFIKRMNVIIGAMPQGRP